MFTKRFSLYQCCVGVVCLAGVFAPPVSAQSAPCTIEVQADRPGAAIAPTLYGAFFEDINFGADGGLSAELVKNGSFEFPEPVVGWGKIEAPGASGGYGIRFDDPCYRNNPHYARVSVHTPGPGFGLRNDGYRGMGVKQGARYRFSAAVRLVEGGPQALRVELVAPGTPEPGRPPMPKILGTAKVVVSAGAWTTVEAVVTADATEPKAMLQILADHPGVFDIEAVSLMPEDTWKGRRNGLRGDLVQMLADLKPGLLRFPGGCIVEGRTLSGRYRWKDTIRPVEERPLLVNRWNTTFAHRGRGAHDYFQSFRVGFFEYFLLCEDIGAEPLPILNCGMACQYDSGECAPLEALEPYVQDALDLIEFANGPAASAWGRRRAEMGHPEPFGLKFIGIGNEQWGPQYFERYEKIAAAVRARHPGIRLVVSAGPKPDDEKFAYAWERLRAGVKADLVDEHCYAKPDWFLDSSRRYDSYDRRGPKIFMGEYAAHVDAPADRPAERNTWLSALAEAAFMAGMERNAGVVEMSAYAPLFAHADAWQWAPDLIWFDNLRVYPTPNYHVQRLFSLNRGDDVLPVRTAGVPAAPNGEPRLYVTASRDRASGDIILKVVNATGGDVTADLALAGDARVSGTMRVVTLGANDLKAVNSFERPDAIAPRQTEVAVSLPRLRHVFPAQSLVILRLGTRL